MKIIKMEGIAVLTAALLMGAAPGASWAQVAADPGIHIGAKDVGGVVTSSNGLEAGVWVIAETTDLPTKFVRIVVTDEKGRYLIPDLPAATYDVWVRGYGLVDSKKVKVSPGKNLNLAAVVAPNAAAAAQYYPALWWFTLLKIPPASDFPGTGSTATGNGIDPKIKTQGAWLDEIKTDGCQSCHQVGTKATRTLSPALGHFATSYDAWFRRIQSGQAGTNMINAVSRVGAQKAISLFADWTDRIAAGELPKTQPPRPQGIERNVVITEWDWSHEAAYLHDVASTDRRNPTVNAYGPVYGTTELSSDYVPVLDPVKNIASELKLPVRDPKTPSTITDAIFAPSIYWGAKPVWDSQTVPHSLMLDETGRVWYTARIRPADDPTYCKKGSSQPSAAYFPLEKSTRQVIMYDPKTKTFNTIDTCYQIQHIQFSRDAADTIWFSSGNNAADVVGWLNVKVWDQTHDEKKAQGWAPFILDTNGDGQPGPYVEPNQTVDPTKDKRVKTGLYGVAPSPVDGTIWGSTLGYPGGIVHIIQGENPPTTTLSEYFEAPADDPKAPVKGYSPRGMDIDSNGVVWTSLASGHLASFDRRKCIGPLKGPTATGKQCPEGWTLYKFPGPQFEGVTASGSGEASYYDWVDQFDALGLGKDVPVATGNQSDSLLAMKDGKFIAMRVPYPMGFFAKGLDGRIDDPNGGWKARGIWSSYSERAVAHIEGGEDTGSKVVHFQIRPDPLAD
jgi:hypothetical protein